MGGRAALVVALVTIALLGSAAIVATAYFQLGENEEGEHPKPKDKG